jgi:predicted outer membrane repeat protein
VGGQSYPTLAAAIDGAPDGTAGSPTVITLLADVALTNNDMIGLNGSKHVALVVPAGYTRTIKPAASFPDYAALFTVASGSASLTLGQPSGGGTLIIDGGNTEGVPSSTNSLISLNNGPVIMYDDVILQNHTTSNGGGAVVIGNAPDSVFTMYGGIIQGCQAANGGGVANVNSTPGVVGFKMLGGTIRGNTATVSGGGVYTEGTFVKTGGLISGNPTTGDTGDHTTESATRDDCNVAPATKGSSVYASGANAKLGTWTANPVAYDTDIDAAKVTGAANPGW